MTYAEWIASYLSTMNPLGRCAGATMMMVEAFPELVRVPGHVQCAWGRRAHWWCVTPDGGIVDPTVSQFPGGLGGIERYEPWEPGEPVRVGRCMECGADIMATLRGSTNRPHATKLLQRRMRDRDGERGDPMKDYETASGMPRLHACPPSAALERHASTGDASTVGSAKHDHMHDRARFGVDEAMQKLPEVLARWGLSDKQAQIAAAQMRKFSWCPPASAFGEFALALLTDGTVEKTFGARGTYPELDDGGRLHGRAFLAGSLDVMWSEPEPLDLTDPARPKCPPGSTLFVVDYKSGDEANVEPVETNAQLIANTVMAAIWTGAERALPAILYLSGEEGEWDAPVHVWGPKEIAAARELVGEILARRKVQIERARAGEPLFGFHEGPWCKFCPGRSSCDAKVRMMRSVVEMSTLPDSELTMTEAQYTWWAERLSQADGFLYKIREVLKARVDDSGPIPLPNGLVWGLKPDTKPTITFNARKALPIVAAEIGEDEAWAIVSMSKSAIEDAVKANHEARGLKRQGAPTMRRIFGEVARAKGLVEETRLRYGAYRPSLALPSGDDSDDE